MLGRGWADPITGRPKPAYRRALRIGYFSRDFLRARSEPIRVAAQRAERRRASRPRPSPSVCARPTCFCSSTPQPAAKQRHAQIPSSPPRRGYMAWCALRSRVLPLPASAATAAPHGLLLRFLLSTAAPHYHRRRRVAPTVHAAAAAEAPLPMTPRFGRATRHPGGAASVARVYADANAQRPKEYWDYESLDIQWGYAHGAGAQLTRGLQIRGVGRVVVLMFMCVQGAGWVRGAAEGG